MRNLGPTNFGMDGQNANLIGIRALWVRLLTQASRCYRIRHTRQQRGTCSSSQERLEQYLRFIKARENRLVQSTYHQDSHHSQKGRTDRALHRLHHARHSAHTRALRLVAEPLQCCHCRGGCVGWREFVFLGGVHVGRPARSSQRPPATARMIPAEPA